MTTLYVLLSVMLLLLMGFYVRIICMKSTLGARYTRFSRQIRRLFSLRCLMINLKNQEPRIKEGAALSIENKQKKKLASFLISKAQSSKGKVLPLDTKIAQSVVLSWLQTKTAKQLHHHSDLHRQIRHPAIDGDRARPATKIQ